MNRQLRVREKDPALHCYGVPEWLIRPCNDSLLFQSHAIILVKLFTHVCLCTSIIYYQTIDSGCRLKYLYYYRWATTQISTQYNIIVTVLCHQSYTDRRCVAPQCALVRCLLPDETSPESRNRSLCALNTKHSTDQSSLHWLQLYPSRISR